MFLEKAAENGQQHCLPPAADSQSKRKIPQEYSKRVMMGRTETMDKGVVMNGGCSPLVVVVAVVVVVDGCFVGVTWQPLIGDSVVELPLLVLAMNLTAPKCHQHHH